MVFFFVLFAFLGESMIAISFDWNFIVRNMCVHVNSMLCRMWFVRSANCDGNMTVSNYGMMRQAPCFTNGYPFQGEAIALGRLLRCTGLQEREFLWRFDGTIIILYSDPWPAWDAHCDERTNVKLTLNRIGSFERLSVLHHEYTELFFVLIYALWCGDEKVSWIRNSGQRLPLERVISLLRARRSEIWVSQLVDVSPKSLWLTKFNFEIVVSMKLGSRTVRVLSKPNILLFTCRLVISFLFCIEFVLPSFFPSLDRKTGLRIGWGSCTGCVHEK